MARFTVALAVLLASLSLSQAWSPVLHKRVSSVWRDSRLISSRSYSTFTSSRLYDSPPRSYGDLLLFNSKSRQKQVFLPMEENKVSMYTCGPTVYDSAHVGNFRAFLTYDVLKRVLAYFGLNVEHICNLTDVDDKIIARCQRDNVDAKTLTQTYERAFMDDLQLLNIVPASRYPRATEHIPDMVDMIVTLEKNGLAYQTSDGSWYFDTQNAPEYGTQLVQLSVDDMESTSSNLEDEKRSFQDFCLWKAAKEEDLEDLIWETSIGKGRPGWHLECSAMAKRYLGTTIDIHCGGIDLKFPHHENEIAQSEGAFRKPFCNCWIHNGFVNIGEEKMSKSLGNFLTLQQACPKPDDVRAFRYLVVSSHYRSDLSFTEQAMKGAKKSLKRIDKVRTGIQEALRDSDDDRNDNESEIANEFVPAQMENFETALKDDLSMPRAAACLFSLVKAAEAELKKKRDLDLTGLRAIYDAMDEMDRVFGIFYKVPSQEEEPKEVPPEVLELVGKRVAAKEAKDWELADSLRSRIAELGFSVKDVKGGEPIVSPVE